MAAKTTQAVTKAAAQAAAPRAAAQAASQPAPTPALPQPSRGGCWIRQPDGSLLRDTAAHPDPEPTTTHTEEPTP